MERSNRDDAPTVSVVMPVRNVETYVDESLRSLLNQTLSDIEIIVVDDGSTDATLTRVLAFQDRRIRVVSGQGQGVSAARNRGIAAARGTYVAFMDGDDTCSHERLERQVSTLEADGHLVGVGTSYRAIDSEGQAITDALHLADADDLKAAMYSFNPFCGSSLMFRRDALARVGGYRESLGLGEDYDLCARVLVETSGLLANLADPLYHYRWHAGSTSARRRGDLAFALSEVREELWRLHPPVRPSYSRLSATRREYRRLPFGDELCSLQTSAYLQTGLRMVRRGRALDGLFTMILVSILDPLSILRVATRGARRVAVVVSPREMLRRAIAYALRFLVRRVPPRKKGARMVAAVNRIVPPPDSPLQVTVARDVVLSCNVRDSIGWRIFYRGEFEPALTGILQGELRPGDVFVDIGANCGYHTLLAASRVGTEGRVHAFEPAAALADRLTGDVVRNGFGDRVRVHQVAVGAAHGTAVLEMGSDATSPEGTRHLGEMGSPAARGETVEVVALDTHLADERVDVVKLDIEGYEESALAGMRCLLQKSQPRLVVVEAVESHLARFGSSIGRIVALMAELGYRHTFLREPGYDDVLVFRPVPRM